MKLPSLPRRRPELPSEAAGRLGLDRGERVLAWSPLPGDGVVAATVVGLSVSTAGDAAAGARVRRPWVDVDHAAWDEDSRTLAIWWVGSRQPTPLELEPGSFLPEVVHERVRASVVVARDVPLPGRRPVWVALRKAADGTLTTQAVAPPGVRLDDPEVAAAVAHAQAVLREEAGLPAMG